ncbi:hypothetical protein C8Q76DRAFT_698390 [Earliella scabrosa]|nr:hypothetical protein C8Q76DRAFT_698390 [Earliella scabrosa]
MNLVALRLGVCPGSPGRTACLPCILREPLCEPPPPPENRASLGKLKLSSGSQSHGATRVGKAKKIPLTQDYVLWRPLIGTISVQAKQEPEQFCMWGGHGRRRTKFIAQLCYMIGVAGAYVFIGELCKDRHWPVQQGPSDAQLAEIEDERARLVVEGEANTPARFTNVKSFVKMSRGRVGQAVENAKTSPSLDNRALRRAGSRAVAVTEKVIPHLRAPISLSTSIPHAVGRLGTTNFAASNWWKTEKYWDLNQRRREYSLVSGHGWTDPGSKTPLTTWTSFRELLDTQRVREGLTADQRDSVEIVISLYEFLSRGSIVALCMWPAFQERLLGIMDLAKRADASMRLLSLIPWSQEIVVPWTRELQRAPIDPEMIARWPRVGGRREIDDTPYESEADEGQDAHQEPAAGARLSHSSPPKQPRRGGQCTTLEMYKLIENLCLCLRGLEIFDRVRRGWVTALADGEEDGIEEGMTLGADDDTGDGQDGNLPFGYKS